MASSELASFLRFAVALVVLFVLGVAAMLWLTRERPQDHLSARVQADVLEVSRSTGRDRYLIRYEYRYDRHTYYATTRFTTGVDDWRSADELWLCIDPDEPTANAPLLDDGVACGDEDLDNGTETAVRLR
ncbi:hypothetical protein ACJ5H2_12010 [Nocardioides sp. R1-1]|uniref:hypothetical protein n=1 Tax=Nocardioides sp. R1-1 TaxID=3383502 RepID=UPI0038D1677A